MSSSAVNVQYHKVTAYRLKQHVTITVSYEQCLCELYRPTFHNSSQRTTSQDCTGLHVTTRTSELRHKTGTGYFAAVERL